MARSAADLAMAMRVLGGPDDDQAMAYRWAMPVPRRTRLPEFRVGYVLDDPACPVTSESKEVLTRAIESLRSAGVQLTERWPEGISLGREFYSYQYLLWTYFTALATDDQATLRARAARPDSNMTTVQARAWSDDFATMGKQMIARERARAIWARWFETHDVFLSPTAFVTAFPHDHSPDQMARTIATAAGPRPYMELVTWIGMATFTGCPATTAPVGLTAAGLPVGIQIMGPYLEDATPIAFAEALGSVIGGYTTPPGY
jgi:amidase